MKLINFMIPFELYDKVKEKAKENGMSTSAYMRFILIQDLKKED